MAKQNVELVHEFCLQHLYMGMAIMKEYKDMEEEDKQRRVNVDRSTMGTNLSRLDGLAISRAYRPRGHYSRSCG